MSYKFDSLIIILNKLDNSERLTVQSFMDQFEVSERTIHRYLNTLLVAGFPILFDRKRNSYTFEEGYTLRKLDLSVEETLSFSLAKKMLGNLGSGVQNSLNKLEEKLSIKKSGIPNHIFLSVERPPEKISSYFAAIHQAITNFQKIEMKYKALHSEGTTDRIVDPYYVYFHEGIWHLRGHCHLRNSLRSFALDRIESLKVLPEYFIPCRVSPEEELAGSFGNWIDGKPVEVVFRFDNECVPYVTRKKWHQSQTETELPDGRLEMRFHINGLGGIKWWVYRWLPYVEIVAPRELRDELVADLSAGLKKHRKKKNI